MWHIERCSFPRSLLVLEAVLREGFMRTQPLLIPLFSCSGHEVHGYTPPPIPYLDVLLGHGFKSGAGGIYYRLEPLKAVSQNNLFNFINLLPLIIIFILPES